MALIHCDFYSETLGLSTAMKVILPQETSTQIGLTGTVKKGKHPTLYLLHGLTDDHSIWTRRTSLERYVASLGLAVVMPNVHRSCYTDMSRGYPFWTFISEELPNIARSFFPLSEKREDNFAAGLSMGGYGAFKLAFRCPDRFAACASLSGALDVAGLAGRAGENDEIGKSEYENIFGDIGDITGSEDDLFYMAEKAVAAGRPIPRLYQCCGKEDFLYGDNLRFKKHAEKLSLDLTYEEGPGEHEWGYWDVQIQQVLKWLSILQ